MELKIEEIAQELGAQVIGGAADGVVRRVSTDSRTIRPGDCFVALRGTAFDGHDFAADAVESGAATLVVAHPVATPAPVVQLIVPDTLYALGEIARMWRSRLTDLRVATVAGSSGKTTVKEMAAAIVGTTRPTLATEGNLNNLIGVPLTLMRLEPHHRAAIIELGMNAPGELRRLVEIVQPDCVALTNIRNAHVGMFETPEQLYQAKVESLLHAPASATFIMSADDPASQRARLDCAKGHRVISFGVAPEATVRAADVRPLVPFGYAFNLCIEGQKPVAVELHVFGQHNVTNALAAAAIAHFFGVDALTIARALCGFRSASNRSEVEEVGGVYVVKDYYNASPAAVEAALLSLKDFSVPGRRYAVLGDMLELGSWEHMYHECVGKVAAQAGLARLYCYGPRSVATVNAARAAGLDAQHFNDIEALARALAADLAPGDLVLIKGSRLMKLERLYDLLKGTLSTAAS
jgi:UDP-N-acetylmuramoyl-tripeptide--D-alanyl-D-alanine ligase